MLNRKKILFGFLLLLIMTFGFFIVNPLAQSVVPGSDADPLVSKSYVDSRVNELIAMIGNISHPAASSAEANIDIEALKWEIISELNLIDGASLFAPVNAARGQIILGGQGTEILLRTGRAVAYSTGENGLVNITVGMEIFSGFEIPANHLLLTPRDDGRGVMVTSTEAWFMVKGGYQIVELP